MRKIKIETVTRENFLDYGSCTKMLDPDGFYFGDAPAKFYRDRVMANFDSTSLVAFCVSQLDPRPLTIERTEYHDNTCEVIMPIDGDVVIHVGPARKEPVYPEFRAFLLPKGTLVCLRPGVFHASPIAAGKTRVHALLVLPERMYNKDCRFFYPSDEEKIEMEF